MSEPIPMVVLCNQYCTSGPDSEACRKRQSRDFYLIFQNKVHESTNSRKYYKQARARNSHLAIRILDQHLYNILFIQVYQHFLYFCTLRFRFGRGNFHLNPQPALIERSCSASRPTLNRKRKLRETHLHIHGQMAPDKYTILTVGKFRVGPTGWRYGLWVCLLLD